MSLNLFVNVIMFHNNLVILDIALTEFMLTM